MTEYCKHGFDMARTCRKCGRIVKVEAPDFAAKKMGFTRSIGRLEDTVRRMNAELAKPISPPARAPQTAEPEPFDKDDDPPPPPPVERYPWQRG